MKWNSIYKSQPPTDGTVILVAIKGEPDYEYAVTFFDCDPLGHYNCGWLLQRSSGEELEFVVNDIPFSYWALIPEPKEEDQ